MLGINDHISCDDVAKTTDDYDYCNISFDNDGKASVTIAGKGKFEGMAVCNATKTSASISSGCYSDEACFAYQNPVIDFDINPTSCQTYFTDWGMSSDEISSLCSTGEDPYGDTISDYVNYGWGTYDNLSDAGVITNVEYADGIEITGYNTGCESDVWVPDTIDNKTVIGIGTNAFNSHLVTEGAYNNNDGNNIMLLSNNSNRISPIPIEGYCWTPGYCYDYSITSIKLPSTIEYIGYQAFRINEISGELDFSNLTNLKTIGEEAFSYNQLRSITIPKSVTSIGEMAFDQQVDEEDNSMPINVYLGNPDAEIGCQAFGLNIYIANVETSGLPDDYVDSCR